MKKILSLIANFFKLIFQVLLSPFIKNKKNESKNKKTENIIKSEKLEQLKKEQLNYTGAINGTPPDENPLIKKEREVPEANEDDETESTRIYTLPKQFERILNPNEKYSYLAFSDEEIDNLINEELEEVYKEKGFKVYKANNVTKKKIDKLMKSMDGKDLQVTCLATSSTLSRMTGITVIYDQTTRFIKLVQKGNKPKIDVTKQDVKINKKKGGTQKVGISCNSDTLYADNKNWTLIKYPDWCEVTVTSGNELSIKAGPLTKTDPDFKNGRNGYVVIRSQSEEFIIRVEQK